MSETAAETKKTLKQFTEALSPKKMTSKQEKADDGVEDKRKKEATAEVVTINKTFPSVDDETPELTGSDPVEQGETELTESHGDVMSSTMEQGLVTQECHKVKANRFKLEQLVAENGDPAKIERLKKSVENKPKIVKCFNKV